MHLLFDIYRSYKLSVSLNTYASGRSEQNQTSHSFLPRRSNGKVSLRRPLDFETNDRLTFTIEGSDGVHAVTREVIVNVENVNDNSPIFDPPVEHVSPAHLHTSASRAVA